MVERVGSKTESGYNFLNLNRLSSVLSRYIDKESIVKHARDSPRCSRSKRSTITDGKKKISKESLDTARQRDQYRDDLRFDGRKKRKNRDVCEHTRNRLDTM